MVRQEIVVRQDISVTQEIEMGQKWGGERCVLESVYPKSFIIIRSHQKVYVFVSLCGYTIYE